MEDPAQSSQALSASLEPADSADATRIQLDEIRRQLGIPVPEFILDLQGKRRKSSDARRRLHACDFNGQKGAIPLSVVRLDPNLNVPAVIGASVEDLVVRLEAQHASIGSLRQRCLEPLAVGITYTHELNLELNLLSATGTATLSVLEALRPGETWRVEHDTDIGLPLVEADLVCRPVGKLWLGAVTEVKGWPDDEFEELHAYATAMDAFPVLATYVKDKKTQCVYWSESESRWLPAPPHLRTMVQISAIISSRIIVSKSQSQKPDGEPFEPKIVLPVMTGTRIFFVAGLVEYINSLPYSRLAISPIYSLNHRPLRSVLTGIALYHVDTDTLAVPPSLDSALVCGSTISAAAVQMTVEAAEALADLQKRRSTLSRSARKPRRIDEAEEDDDEGAGTSGGMGPAGGSGTASAQGTSGGAGGVRRSSRLKRLSKGTASKSEAQEEEREVEERTGERFETSLFIVVRTSEGHATAPMLFLHHDDLGSSLSSRSSSDDAFDDHAYPSPSRSAADLTPDDRELSSSVPSASVYALSPPIDPPVVLLDTLLYNSASTQVYGSSTTGLAVKLVEMGDEAEEELIREAEVYEDIQRSAGDSSAFLVPFYGLFSAFSGEMALFTGLGEPVEDWSPYKSDIIHLVSRLHSAGYTHGDLASRNIVKTSAGLRLVDLGRATRADREEMEWEMTELKAVLEGQKEEIEY
ncbi:hypothetical protein JCM10049v2_003885 [Rhodotorula toruloides]